jgi:hypothetical protein
VALKKSAVVTYANNYGSLKLAIAGEYRNVGSIRGAALPEDVFVSIEDAEKIALITDNRRIQIGFAGMDPKRGFVMHHASQGRPAVYRVAEMDFKPGVDATKELERPAWYSAGM